MLVYLSLDMICSSKLTVLHLGADNVRGQKFLYVFAPIEAILFICCDERKIKLLVNVFYENIKALR